MAAIEKSLQVGDMVFYTFSQYEKCVVYKDRHKTNAGFWDISNEQGFYEKMVLSLQTSKNSLQTENWLDQSKLIVIKSDGFSHSNSQAGWQVSINRNVLLLATG